MDDDVFAALLIPDELLELSDGAAWTAALVRAEVALAQAEAECGVIPAAAAEAIAAAAGTFRPVPAQVAREGRAVGNLAAGIVPALTAHVAREDSDAAKYVHLGATSQDIVDTAAMLVSAALLARIEATLRRLAARLASLVEQGGDTVLVGRTLLQQALPTTLAAKAANWLSGVVDAVEEVGRVRRDRLAAQLGGAVGTLASLSGAGPAVLSAYARRLGLPDPDVPWHTNRTRVASVAGAAALVAGVADKIALDLVLMAQTEVGEFAEANPAGSGGSSTMPHKRNPIAATLARSAALQVPGLVSTLHLAMAHEHERAAGAWHAEWQPLLATLRLCGAAVVHLDSALDGARFPTEAAQANLELTRGLLMAERVTTRLAASLGRLPAHHLMQRLSVAAAADGVSLRTALLGDPELTAALTTDEIDELFDPAGYLGSGAELAGRALRRWRRVNEGATHE